MKVLIVGAGALGGLVGAHLAEGGAEVVLLEVNRARAGLLNETGLFLSEADKGERCVRMRVACEAGELSEMDLVFIAVKSYQTEDAVRGVQKAIGPGTLVLSMQNGIGNADTIARVIGRS